MFFVLALFSAVADAQAAKRLALLIGNQNYRIDSLDLKNPYNDIEAISQALKQVGFEDVRIFQDAGIGKLQREVNRYASRLRRAGKDAVGFFYYSGHGALNEQDRFNYIIPTDVETIDSVELWDGSIRLERIIDDLKDKASNAVHFVIFDACRNELKLSQKGSRALVQPKGFTPIRTTLRGMLISYSTAEGKVASDVGERAGPYAEALASAIVTPGVEAVTMFR
ncbi:MAG: caspase family protein, partial [Pseudomonadota bacterium]